jgi:hypothetical protein
MAAKKPSGQKRPTIKSLSVEIERLEAQLEAEQGKVARLESELREQDEELARLRGPMNVEPGPAVPRGTGGKWSKARVASFMTTRREPKR